MAATILLRYGGVWAADQEHVSSLAGDRLPWASPAASQALAHVDHRSRSGSAQRFDRRVASAMEADGKVGPVRQCHGLSNTAYQQKGSRCGPAHATTALTFPALPFGALAGAPS